MLEAGACGTPVVTTRWGAAPEIVEDGVNGLLCTDEESVLKALCRVSQLDRADCRRVVEDRFSAQRMVRAHVRLYESVVAREGRRAEHRARRLPHRTAPGEGQAALR
jgi:glycosyltransferase involved in cell wall biosynthesis